MPGGIDAHVHLCQDLKTGILSSHIHRNMSNFWF
jgi:hypothetical protein